MVWFGYKFFFSKYSEWFNLLILFCLNWRFKFDVNQQLFSRRMCTVHRVSQLIKNNLKYEIRAEFNLLYSGCGCVEFSCFWTLFYWNDYGLKLWKTSCYITFLGFEFYEKHRWIKRFQSWINHHFILNFHYSITTIYSFWIMFFV